MVHIATRGFWLAYNALPPSVRRLADKNFGLLQANARHPSLRFKRVGPYWSVRVGRDYRALATDSPEGIAWFWIGRHEEYELLIRS